MRHLDQRGDTLVEVMIATAILTVVLAASYNIAGAVFRLGQSAKERTQAANLIQEQAEALRSFRDSRSWAQFTHPVNGVPRDSMFWMIGDGGEWRVQRCIGSPNPFYPPGDSLFCRNELFTLYIDAEQVEADKYSFRIAARWERPGTQPDEDNPDSYNHTTITTFLANLDGLLVPQGGD